MFNKIKPIITVSVILTSGILILEPLTQSLLPNNLQTTLFSTGAISLVIYGIYLVWQKWLWKIKNPVTVFVGSLLGFENIPVIEGKYEGVMKSSFQYDYNDDKYTKVMKAEVEIIQKSYQNIKIKSTFYKEDKITISSKSESDYAKFVRDREFGESDNKWAIIYNYLNNPNSNISEKDSRTRLPKQKHFGCGMFTSIENGQTVIEGFYGNGEERKTRGYYELRKIS